MSNFLSRESIRKWRGKARHALNSRAAIVDFFDDIAGEREMRKVRASDAYQQFRGQRILVVGVQSDRSPGSLDRVYEQLRSDRHQVTFDSKRVEAKGKLENTNIIIDRHSLDQYDWVIMTDDDIAVGSGFLDDFIFLAHHCDLAICGPAHKAFSYASYPPTRRKRGILVKETDFVEVGPTVAFRSDTFSSVFPFPNLKYGWGLDSHWPDMARKKGWKIGVVDGAPLRHLKPIGATYNLAAAYAEADDYRQANDLPLGSCEPRVLALKNADEVLG